MGHITLDHVDKVYPGGVKALDDLNPEVREGEFMVLVGPSGCGESTALRSIAGLEMTGWPSGSSGGTPPGPRSGGGSARTPRCSASSPT